ncbi:Serine/threonine-protein_kinase 11-interacting protein [Hexamita inflata]|uniref:Serine/threonine-protein kinase 11-interacting protein n=1 Tax=Hexamita inflata TaxID=28002 RepID=A0AA86R9I8_9EUKA|nr:Serine/threonine-protein kinase 11-interacting protein [Hexamita inflata]
MKTRGYVSFGVPEQEDLSLSTGLRSPTRLNTEKISYAFQSLEKVPNVAQIVNIRHLNLSGNKLRSISFIQQMRSLVTLNVSNNELKSLRGLENHSTLLKLNVSCNYLTKSSLQSLYSTILTNVQLSSDQQCEPGVDLSQFNCDENPFVDSSYPFNIFVLLPQTVAIVDHIILSAEAREHLSGQDVQKALSGVETMIHNGLVIDTCQRKKVQYRAPRLSNDF